jgi:hypothetical protein
MDVLRASFVRANISPILLRCVGELEEHLSLDGWRLHYGCLEVLGNSLVDEEVEDREADQDVLQDFRYLKRMVMTRSCARVQGAKTVVLRRI